MSDTIQVALGLALSFLFGASLLRRLGIRSKEDPLAFLAASYAAGTFATGAFLLAWLLLGGPVTAGTPIFFVAAATTLLLLPRAAARGGWTAPAPRTFPMAERAIFAAVLLVGLVGVVDGANTGNYRPVVEGDEGVIWSAKAKALYTAEGFGEDFLEEMSDPFQPWAKDYPLLNPLLQVWAFSSAGQITHAANRLPSQATLAAVLLLAASALRRRVRPGLAALLLLLLLPSTTSPIFGHSIYADPMVALGLLLALDAWLRLHEGASPTFSLSLFLSLGLAYAVASKHEGLLFLAAIAVASGIARLSNRSGLGGRARLVWVFALPLACGAMTWAINQLTGTASQNEFLRPDDEGRGLLARFLAQGAERIGPVFEGLARRVVLNVEWTGLLVATFLLLSLSLPRRALRAELRIPTLALCLALAGVAGTYLVTPRAVSDHMEFSLQRVTYQFLPAIALWVASLLARLEPPLSALPSRAAEASRGGTRSSCLGRM